MSQPPQWPRRYWRHAAAAVPGSSAASSSGGPKRGGTLRFAIAGGAAGDTPDPALAADSFTLYMAANLYDTLVRADQKNFNLTRRAGDQLELHSGREDWIVPAP